MKIENKSCDNTDALNQRLFHSIHSLDPRTTDTQRKSQTFGLGQTNWADNFWGISGIFGRTIRTHFGIVSPLSMFSINEPLFLQKTKPFYPMFYSLDKLKPNT